jgi:hypothetical protein
LKATKNVYNEALIGSSFFGTLSLLFKIPLTAKYFGHQQSAAKPTFHVCSCFTPCGHLSNQDAPQNSKRRKPLPIQVIPQWFDLNYDKESLLSVCFALSTSYIPSL